MIATLGNINFEYKHSLSKYHVSQNDILRKLFDIVCIMQN